MSQDSGVKLKMSFKDIRHAKHEIEKWELGTWDEKHNKAVLNEMYEFVNKHDEAIRKEHKLVMDTIKDVKEYFEELHDIKGLLNNIDTKDFHVNSTDMRNTVIRHLKSMHEKADKVEKDIRIAHKILKKLD